MLFSLLLLGFIVLFFLYKKDPLFLEKVILPGHQVTAKLRIQIRKLANAQKKARMAQKYKQQRQRLEQQHTRQHLELFVREIEQKLDRIRPYISPELAQRTKRVLKFLLNQENYDGLIRIHEILTSKEQGALEQALSSELTQYYIVL